jgi:hypothetical protein
MNGKCTFAGMLAFLYVTGCQTLPPGAERGPSGTMAYNVLIEASEPGAQIEANGQVVGQTPLQLKIFGDPDGTFHDFGSDFYIIRALPLTTNQYAQAQMFGTGRWFGPEDRIPERVSFDMNQKPPERPPAPLLYPYPYPYYYPPPYYYGPSFYLYSRPYHHHTHHHHHRDGLRVHPRRR